MDFSKIKLIVTDMDGTLLNGKGELEERFFDLFAEIRKRDILFAVASGRQYYSLLNKMEKVKEEIVFIAENGAIVIHNETQLHIRPMDRKVAMAIVERLKEIGGKYIIVCGKQAAYIEETDPRFMEPFLMHYDKYEVVEDLTKIDDDEILKVTVCDLSGAEEHTLPHVAHLKDKLQVKLSGEIWIDFTHKDAQKGNALKALQTRYGISEEDTMAFGDYLNDLELLDHANFSYAMKNAHEQVLERAKYIAKSNDEGGVLLVLEEVVGGTKSAGKF